MGKKRSTKEKKVSSRKSSKEKKVARSKDITDDGLALVLNGILLDCPELIEEIPSIFHSLNEEEFVQIKMITNKTMRESLCLLMTYIPGMEEHPQHGWYWKKTSNCSVNYSVLDELLSGHSIIEPKCLSISQQRSSRSAPLLLDLVKSFPELKTELSSIFHQLLQGTAVQLQDLPDEQLVEGLERFFKSLNIPETLDGYGISQNSSSKGERELLEESVKFYLDILDNYKKYLKIKEKIFPSDRKTEYKESTKAEEIVSDSSCANSDEESTSSSSSSNNENDLTEVIREPLKKVLGPTLPSASDLHLAQTGRYYSENDEDDDEDIGPRVMSSSNYPVRAMVATSRPLGMTGVTDVPSQDNMEEEEEVTELGGQREEWISTPGDSKAFAILDPTNLTNRKFQSGKQAKKFAEKLQIQKAAQRALMEQQNGIVEEDLEPQRPSLMEEHLSKKAKKDHSTKDTSGARKPFEREKDLLAGKKLNEKEVKFLVENAKDLNSKFDKAVVQRTFL
jgi:hypothetical protein